MTKILVDLDEGTMKAVGMLRIKLGHKSKADTVAYLVRNAVLLDTNRASEK